MSEHPDDNQVVDRYQVTRTYKDYAGYPVYVTRDRTVTKGQQRLAIRTAVLIVLAVFIGGGLIFHFMTRSGQAMHDKEVALRKQVSAAQSAFDKDPLIRITRVSSSNYDHKTDSATMSWSLSNLPEGAAAHLTASSLCQALQHYPEALAHISALTVNVYTEGAKKPLSFTLANPLSYANYDLPQMLQLVSSYIGV